MDVRAKRTHFAEEGVSPEYEMIWPDGLVIGDPVGMCGGTVRISVVSLPAR